MKDQTNYTSDRQRNEISRRDILRLAGGASLAAAAGLTFLRPLAAQERLEQAGQPPHMGTPGVYRFAIGNF